MKKLLFSLFLALCSMLYVLPSAYAQTIPPPYINYQAVLYDVNSATPNAVLANQSFQTFVNILDQLGNLLYKEEHFASTDANGLITVKMGDGVYTAGTITNFNQINWSVGKYYLVVDFNINGTISSTAPEQLVTVPYSFYSGNAGNGMTGVADNGNGTLTFTYTNGSTYTTPTLSGIQGPTGATGPQGPAGAQGANGQSAYELWLAQGNTGTVQDFLTSSAYQIWLAQGNTGSQQTFLNTLVGPAGATGANGAPGTQGPIGLTGPTGPQGVQGIAGTNGLNALINTTTEPAGANCVNGGTKIETGLDANGNGVLEAGEVNTSQTTYICGSQTSAGIGLGFSNTVIFQNSGAFNWTVPIGVTKVMVEVWGAGGGGGNGGRGGSGGGYGKQVFTVVSGDVYSVTIGLGGLKGTCADGGTTSFGSLISATGGTSACANPPQGGTSNAQINISGGRSCPYNGGDGANGGAGGYDAFAPQAPGGGGGSGTSGGSNGAAGRAIIWY